jgi:hypothetical protein
VSACDVSEVPGLTDIVCPSDTLIVHVADVSVLVIPLEVTVGV